MTKKGFSLIELIFVIIILGVVASVAVPKLFDSRSDALATVIKKDINTISASIQNYHISNGSIAKISDAVNINSTNWSISNTQLQFNVDEGVCVDININDGKLNVIIMHDINDLCKKIYDSGVRSVTYDLL